MNKFKVGDRVRVIRISVSADIPYLGNTYKVEGIKTDGALHAYDLEGVNDVRMFESQLELVSSEYYILEYMKKDGDFSMEEFDTKEEALEHVEENSNEIDFDEPVKLLVVSKVFDVKKTKGFELVEE